MALTHFQQLEQLLQNSQYILVVFDSTSIIGDTAASALTLKHWLEKKQKKVDLVCDGFILPKKLSFLEGSECIRPELAHLQKFIIKVDVSKVDMDTISYDIKDGWLSVYLTPKHGSLTKNNLRTAQSTFKYDLIITIGANDLESLGSIFLNNTDLFYRTPIINIDHRATNEHFGQMNLVDLTATSAAEIIYQALQQLDSSLLNDQMATALLTGMIAATKSFKTQNVTPFSLNIASELMKLGGDREKIIRHLYQMKSLPTLKLWGQALSHLIFDPTIGLISTSITRDDCTRSGATTEDIHGVVEELIANSPEAKIILLTYETSAGNGTTTTQAVLETDKEHNALELAAKFGARGDKRQATFTIANQLLDEATRDIITEIKTQLHQ